jgi:hypothetical protein
MSIKQLQLSLPQPAAIVPSPVAQWPPRTLTPLQMFGIHGTRTTARGQIVNTDMAGRLFRSLSLGEKVIAARIFELPPHLGAYNAERQLVLSAGVQSIEANGTNYSGYTVPAGAPIRVCDTLRNAVRDGGLDTPLVFLVRTNVPHTMIVIMHAGICYTAGFGYYGDAPPNSAPIASKIHTAISYATSGVEKMRHQWSRVSSSPLYVPKWKWLNDAEHYLPKQGAIYSTDYLFPQPNHAARIAWVGLLTPAILNRLDASLARTTKIIIESSKHDVGIRAPLIIDQTYLIVPDVYIGAADAHGYRGKFYDCFTWARAMLGLTGLKDNTQPILPGLVAELLAAMQRNDIRAMNDVFRNINIAAVRRSELGGGRSRGKRSIKHKNIKTRNKRKQQAITRTNK